MDEVCDICRKNNVPGSKYCADCGVDLKEDRSETPYHPKKARSSKGKRKKKTEPENERIT